MTIKSKLTVNAIVVLGIIAGVVLASVAALVIVKGRLYDLTEKSTPFQTRTMELQRAIHASTADLIKVGYAALIDAVVDFRETVFRNIPSVVPSEDLLDDLSDDPKVRAYGETLVADQQDPDYRSPIIMRPLTEGLNGQLICFAASWRTSSRGA